MLDIINDYQTLKLFREGKTEGVPNFDNERAKECLIGLPASKDPASKEDSGQISSARTLGAPAHNPKPSTTSVINLLFVIYLSSLILVFFT